MYNIKFISKKYYTSSTILENHNLIKYLIIIEHFRFHKTCLHALVTTARSTNMYCYLYIYVYIFIVFQMYTLLPRQSLLTSQLTSITHSLNKCLKRDYSYMIKWKHALGTSYLMMQILLLYDPDVNFYI